MRCAIIFSIVAFTLALTKATSVPPDGQCYTHNVCRAQEDGVRGQFPSCPTDCGFYTATHDQSGGLVTQACFKPDGTCVCCQGECPDPNCVNPFPNQFSHNITHVLACPCKGDEEPLMQPFQNISQSSQGPCPDVHGAIQKIDGSTYTWNCRIHHYTEARKARSGRSLVDCGRICSATLGCRAVTYWPNDEESKRCELNFGAEDDLEKEDRSGDGTFGGTLVKVKVFKENGVSPQHVLSVEESDSKPGDKPELKAENDQGENSKEAALSKELAGIPRNQLCPSYNGRDFETTNSDSSRNKWRILCNTMLNHGAWQPDGLHLCRSDSVLDILKERQEEKGRYKGLWIRSDGWCNHVNSNLWTPLAKGPDMTMTHHYIERIE